MADSLREKSNVRGAVRGSGVMIHDWYCVVIGKINVNNDWRDVLVLRMSRASTGTTSIYLIGSAPKRRLAMAT
jgi:hypothetical protein